MKFLFSISIFFAICFSGCFEPDEQLFPNESSDLQVTLHQKRNSTAYINLNKIERTKEGQNLNWHLKFQNTPKGWAIYLNPLLDVAIINTLTTDFDVVDSTFFNESSTWRVDIPTTLGSYPAIGSWGDYTHASPKSFKNVYLISWNDGPTNFISKLQILDATENAYHIRTGDLQGKKTITHWIKKDSDYLHSYFSLIQNQQTYEVEPMLSNWDICLTYLADSIVKYEGFPYEKCVNKQFGLFQGIITNYTKVSICIDSTIRFEDINYFDVKNFNFLKIDEATNIFLHKDNNSLKENLVLLIKSEEKYFAMRLEGGNFSPPSAFSLNFEIKQL